MNEEEQDDVKRLITSVDEINKVSEFLGDESVDEALALIVYLISKPNIPPKLASEYIVKLTAIYAQCKIKIRVYMSLEKSPDNNLRKNVYATVADAIESLFQSLKYVTKV
jgi:hypothetical protein